jgi:hypothetical protein
MAPENKTRGLTRSPATQCCVFFGTCLQVLGRPYVRGWVCGFVMATMLLVGSNSQAQDVEVVAPKAMDGLMDRTKCQ